MRKITILIVSAMISLVAMANQSELVVSYCSRHYDPTGKEITPQMLLLTNKNQSKFFNLIIEIDNSFDVLDTDYR